MIGHDEKWIEDNHGSYYDGACKAYHEHMVKQEGERVASTIYQAFGCIDPDVLPEGEWLRVMDWLSAVAHNETVGELLPVNATAEYLLKLKNNT